MVELCRPVLYIQINVTCCFVGVFKSLISVGSGRHLFNTAVLQFVIIPRTEVQHATG